MNEYQRIRKTLGAIFSIDVGLSDASQTAMLERSLQNPEWRAAFCNELLTAVADTQVSWLDLLFNEEYEVYEASSEHEARNLAMSLLWRPAFPDKPVPQL